MNTIDCLPPESRKALSVGRCSLCLIKPLPKTKPTKNRPWGRPPIFCGKDCQKHATYLKLKGKPPVHLGYKARKLRKKRKSAPATCLMDDCRRDPLGGDIPYCQRCHEGVLKRMQQASKKARRTGRGGRNKPIDFIREPHKIAVIR